jgi:hypothetical protein
MNSIPVFPLPIVIFPDEDVRLHIFEEKYKELILDCEKHSISFCICPIIKNNLQEVASHVRLSKIMKVYEDGRMDIVINCLQLIKVDKILYSSIEKKYASINFTEFINDRASEEDKTIIIEKLFKELCYLNNVKPYHEINWQLFSSYQVGHYIGLSLEDEYHFSTINSENKRLEFIIKQIQKMIYNTKQRLNWIDRLNLNGEFRMFDS